MRARPIEIAYALPGGASVADQEIVRVLREHTAPEEIDVVTSDRGLAEQVCSLNASVGPAEKSRRRLEGG